MSKVLSLKKQQQNDAILKQQSYTNKVYMYTVYASTFVEGQCQLSCMSDFRPNCCFHELDENNPFPVTIVTDL